MYTAHSSAGCLHMHVHGTCTILLYMTFIQKLGINLTHIESRPSITNPDEEYDYYIDCEMEGRTTDVPVNVGEGMRRKQG